MCRLSHFSCLVCHSSRTSHRQHKCETICIGVWACSIPDKQLPDFPRYDGDSPITFHQTGRASSEGSSWDDKLQFATYHCPELQTSELDYMMVTVLLG